MVFREFFERIVQLCVEAGLVWGEELYFDATKVDANASPGTPSLRGSTWRSTWARYLP